jgi:hypothetical protein
MNHIMSLVNQSVRNLLRSLGLLTKHLIKTKAIKPTKLKPTKAKITKDIWAKTPNFTKNLNLKSKPVIKLKK